ncbi:MAG: mercury methylation corrinoid protein HgcA [Geothermobacteraceae bacterium]
MTPNDEQSCCSASEKTSDCCGPSQLVTIPCCDSSSEAETDRRRPGMRIWHFVAGWLDTPVGVVPQVATHLRWQDHGGAILMRWGIGRYRYAIAPGLYAVGNPNPESEVLVTANYKLSFDHLRRHLAGRDLWILVLDTKGINVWCAAGKGTFGTDELVRRIRASRLEELVSHRRLILPQLGAPGVAAHKVKEQTGFRVVYGPIYAADLPAFLDAGLKATDSMRRVRFTLWDRLVLTPVELTGLGKSTLLALLALVVLSGIGPDIYSLERLWTRGTAALGNFLVGLVCGAVITPILLPWLPGRSFAIRGALVGLAAGLGLSAWLTPPPLELLAVMTAVPVLSSWYAMHFTGSTTFTSPTGVEKEMRRAIPVQAFALLLALAFWFARAWMGGGA